MHLVVGYPAAKNNKKKNKDEEEEYDEDVPCVLREILSAGARRK